MNQISTVLVGSLWFRKEPNCHAVKKVPHRVRKAENAVQNRDMETVPKMVVLKEGLHKAGLKAGAKSHRDG